MNGCRFDVGDIAVRIGVASQLGSFCLSESVGDALDVFVLHRLDFGCRFAIAAVVRSAIRHRLAEKQKPRGSPFGLTVGSLGLRAGPPTSGVLAPSSPALEPGFFRNPHSHGITLIKLNLQLSRHALTHKTFEQRFSLVEFIDCRHSLEYRVIWLTLSRGLDGRDKISGIFTSINLSYKANIRIVPVTLRPF